MCMWYCVLNPLIDLINLAPMSKLKELVTMNLTMCILLGICMYIYFAFCIINILLLLMPVYSINNKNKHLAFNACVK